MELCNCFHCRELRRQQFRAFQRQEKLLKLKEKDERARNSV